MPPIIGHAILGSINVRFTPNSGHMQCTTPCLLWANSGHVRCKRSCPLRPPRRTQGHLHSAIHLSKLDFMRAPLPPDGSVLLLIDLQKAIDHPSWGERNNLSAETHIARLLAH